MMAFYREIIFFDGRKIQVNEVLQFTQMYGRVTYKTGPFLG